MTMSDDNFNEALDDYLFNPERYEGEPSPLQEAEYPYISFRKNNTEEERKKFINQYILFCNVDKIVAESAKGYLVRAEGREKWVAKSCSKIEGNGIFVKRFVKFFWNKD